jgi:methyl-accepting chemotaxis protein
MKIGSGYGLALLLLVVGGVVTYRSTTRLLRTADWLGQSYKAHSELEGVVSVLNGAESAQRGFVISGQDRELQPYRAARASIDERIELAKRLLGDNPEQQKRLDALGRLIKGRWAELDDTIELRRSQGFGAASQAVQMSTEIQLVDEIQNLVREIDKAGDEIIARREKAAQAGGRSAILTMIVGILVSFVALTAAGVIITRNISKPLREISETAERIAAGDLTVNITANGRRDEVGQLSHTFTRMVHSLQEVARGAEQIAAGDLTVQLKPQSDKDVLVKALAVMVENLRRTTHQVQEAVSVLATSATGIVSAVAQVASGASETAAAVTETATTVEEVKQTAAMSNQKAKQVSESAQRSVQVSHTGEKSVEETIDGMNRIREQMESIAGSIVRLSEQSQAIGDIISTVNDLAEQSNLLAVNASIEAARAGDQGKGFAVVAQEVKILAEQSKQATSQVRTILSDIQRAMSAAVMAIEQGGKAVEAGVKQSTEAGGSIQSLARNVVEAAQAIVQIEASSRQQLLGMDQVAAAMENIKQASSQNVDSMNRVETAAQNLHELGQTLKQMVEHYKV